ncbi:PIG-L deacetylase family protein [Granulicella cerasi]|uniref:PIG-L deacetylase family protein n=1 Tax=Granulicella cerasi TaxID=741063 RepID=A0ABW1Z8A6_9BACT|nr:PIG-L family deacetylase [Granulicella cerasi]
MKSLTSEKEWLEALAAIPAFVAPVARVVFVAPHPDDETLAAGGLLAALAQAGVPVTIVAVTDGDAAYSPEGDAELAALRIREQIAALAVLGIPESSIIRLGYPDRCVNEHETALAEHLVNLIRPDTTLIAPWSKDFHSDHEAAGRAAEVAAERTGVRLVRWFWWSWHQHTPAELESLSLTKFALDEGGLQRKLRALSEHRSQLGDDAILPDDLLAPAHRSFEVFG